MTTIYAPKGKAREYSPLALSIYQNCDHKCDYCFVKVLQSRYHFDPPIPRKNLIEELTKQAPRFANKAQVLLSFTGDPYCHADQDYKVTRQVLKILLQNSIPVAILTKGGTRALRDLDLFKQFGDQIKIGATLTFTDPRKSRQYEPGAANPLDRYEMLETCHQAGLKTWASLEPVIIADQTLHSIIHTHEFIDEYKVGVTNYYRLPEPINWTAFAHKAIGLLRKYNKKFYIKEDLRKYIDKSILNPEEMDQDYLTIKPKSIPVLSQGSLI